MAAVWARDSGQVRAYMKTPNLYGIFWKTYFCLTVQCCNAYGNHVAQQEFDSSKWRDSFKITAKIPWFAFYFQPVDSQKRRIQINNDMYKRAYIAPYTIPHLNIVWFFFTHVMYINMYVVFVFVCNMNFPLKHIFSFTGWSLYKHHSLTTS